MHYRIWLRYGDPAGPPPEPDLPGEHWLPVPGYEGLYDVSDCGRVRSLPRPAGQRGTKAVYILKPVLRGSVRGKKYATVMLRGRIMKVHRLVLLAFVGPPPSGKTDGCHADDDAMNNHLGNLRWDTRAGNMTDAVKNGRISPKTHCKRGHLFDEENTAINARGMRRCRTCTRLRSNPHGNPHPRDVTHCPKGHKYDEANTFYNKKGGRLCRECSREWARLGRERRKAAALVAAA